MSENAKAVEALVLQGTSESYANAVAIFEQVTPVEAAKVIMGLACHVESAVSLRELAAFGVHLGMFTE